MRIFLFALIATGALIFLTQLGIHRVSTSFHNGYAVPDAEAGIKEAVASPSGVVAATSLNPPPLLRSSLGTHRVDEEAQLIAADRSAEDMVVYGAFDGAKPPFPGVDFQAPDPASDTSTPSFEITAFNEISAADVYENARFGVPDKSFGDVEELREISYEQGPYGELLAPPDPTTSDIYQNAFEASESLTEKYPNAQFVRPGSTGSVLPSTDT